MRRTIAVITVLFFLVAVFRCSPTIDDAVRLRPEVPQSPSYRLMQAVGEISLPQRVDDHVTFQRLRLDTVAHRLDATFTITPPDCTRVTELAQRMTEAFSGDARLVSDFDATGTIIHVTLADTAMHTLTSRTITPEHLIEAHQRGN